MSVNVTSRIVVLDDLGQHRLGADLDPLVVDLGEAEDVAIEADGTVELRRPGGRRPRDRVRSSSSSGRPLVLAGRLHLDEARGELAVWICALDQLVRDVAEAADECGADPFVAGLGEAGGGQSACLRPRRGRRTSARTSSVAKAITAMPSPCLAR